MAKGKAVNNKQEAMGPPKTRGSRKRGYPVEKNTEDDHQVVGDSNTEDTSVQCLKSPKEDGDKKCIEPLALSSSSDGNTYEKNEDSETPEKPLPTAGPKRQLVISLSACGNESNKKNIKLQKQVPNECDLLDDSNKYIDVSAGITPNGSEEQVNAVDNHHKMETNQEVDEVKQISIEPVVEGLAKKRRRMGMCRLSENQRNLFLPKCGNRAEKNERQNENTVEAEEERGSSVEILSLQQQATEMMSHHNNSKETKVETSANGTTLVCEPLSTEVHASENDPKGELYSELITKHHTHAEEGLQRKVIPRNLCSVNCF
ncbi:uncharacterized protein [Eucyclogobius newberryi]|uniref:uncharacterized protein n=1 Tax=Eucyclogobius newberryi TaxID=166745 RepID=UPI003B5A1F6C